MPRLRKRPRNEREGLNESAEIRENEGRGSTGNAIKSVDAAMEKSNTSLSPQRRTPRRGGALPVLYSAPCRASVPATVYLPRLVLAYLFILLLLGPYRWFRGASTRDAALYQRRSQLGDGRGRRSRLRARRRVLGRRHEGRRRRGLRQVLQTRAETHVRKTFAEQHLPLHRCSLQPPTRAPATLTHHRRPLPPQEK